MKTSIVLKQGQWDKLQDQFPGVTVTSFIGKTSPDQADVAIECDNALYKDLLDAAKRTGHRDLVQTIRRQK